MKLPSHLAFLANPTEAIQAALGEVDRIPEQEETVDAAAALFASTFDTRQKVESIPLLNDADVAKIPSGSLVRFRCMVQDNSLDGQIYQKYYPVRDAVTGSTKWKAVKYTDHAPPSTLQTPHDIRSILADRQPYYAVSVPAETEWAREEYSAVSGRIEVKEEEGEKVEISEEDKALAKARLPLGKGVGALVVMYTTAESFAVNEVLEIIGILERTEDSSEMELDDDPFTQLQTRLPSQTVAPRLHAISHRKLDCAGNPKCLDVEEAVQKLATVDTKKLRGKVIQKIAKVLGGDQLAAEYVLLHFLSRIYQRDAALAVGNLPLNLSGLSAQQTSALFSLIRTLLPRAHYLPLELGKINQSSFMPRSTESSGLMAGVLQLAEGTEVLVDEGVLGEGKVQGVGVLNIHALQSVLNFGKLPFAILDGSTDESTQAPQLVQNWLELPVNLNILIVGPTRSGIFPVECVVPVAAEEEELGALAEMRIEDEEEKEVQDIRLYLGIMREGSYNVSEEMVKYIETDFVATRGRQRQNGETLMTQEELIQLCAVARLMTLSHTTNTLTREHWQEAKKLEQRRRERVSTMLPKTRSEVRPGGVMAPVSAA